ncbi:MAG: UDP-3-O-acyl-N-acetylglucosamine deacetylase [Synergistaceae bacterium]|jgi:UDP-3-O-[3-hydroxymyristoyl] N-acetylglucosamine deacetylase|nr:UDP-3-O-acyl-N-acetylglucosamine deacetylase [Synergistaceae bacterium]
MTYRELVAPIHRSGPGLHSGRDFDLAIEPAPGPLTLGIEGGPRLPLSAFSLSGDARGTDFIFPEPNSGVKIRTCEHVLSAMAGCGVWSGAITVGGQGGGEFEMPGMDGCSSDLAREIMEKSAPASVPPEPIRLMSPICSGSGRRCVAAFPSRGFEITYVIDYDAAPIGTMLFDYDGERSDYVSEVSVARTFVMRRDIEGLRASGLALGGSTRGAVVVDDSGVETEGGLRFRDEFVRHKTLDLIGDLAALGRPIAARILALRAGHAQHVGLVELIKAAACPSR